MLDSDDDSLDDEGEEETALGEDGLLHLEERDARCNAKDGEP